MLLLANACRDRDASNSPDSKFSSRQTSAAGEKPLRVDPVETGFDLYFISPPPVSPREMIIKLSGSGANLLHVRTDIPEWPLPEVDPSFYTGITTAQANALATSKLLPLGVRFTLSMSNSLEPLKSAERVIAQLAHETQGVIYDYTADRVFSSEAFSALRLDGWSGDIPDVGKQITVAASKKGQLWRSATHGMERFGLPDIVIADHSAGSLRQVGSILCLIAQSLVEGRSIDTEGRLSIDIAAIRHAGVKRRYTALMHARASGRVNVMLAAGSHDEGDEPNRILLVGFEDSKRSTPQEKHEEAAAFLFGVDDPVILVEHDADYLTARRRAQAQLPKQREQFRRGLGFGEHILVYAPFSTSNGREWMWIEVVEWPAGKVKGLLVSTPQASDLKPGMLVEVPEEQIADYLHEYPDGKSEGYELKTVFENRKPREKSKNSAAQ